MSRPGLVKLRSTPAYATEAAIRHINVDREALVIHNAVVMMANVEAIGHEMMSDMTTLEQVAELGNAARRGVQGKLGHTGLSENGSGRQLFVTRNFRVADTRLLADLHLLEPARASPAFGHDAVEWFMDMADAHPEQIALSCVLGVRKVWVLEHGDEVDASKMDERPENATTELPIIRVESIWGVDAVTEGALTHEGLFDAQFAQMMFADTASEYADEAFQFVDRWRERYNIPLSEVPHKVEQVLARYIYSRIRKDSEMPSRKGSANKLDTVGGVKSSRRKLQFETDAPPTPDEEQDDVLLDEALVDDDDAAEATAPVQPAAENDSADAIDDETDDALDEAIDDDGEDEDADDEAEYDELSAAAILTEFGAIRAEMASLREQHVKLTARSNRLAKLALKQQNELKALRRQVRSLEGEPVGTSSLSGLTGASSFGRGSSFTPPNNLRRQTPGSVSGAKPALNVNFEEDAEKATLEAMAARQPR